MKRAWHVSEEVRGKHRSLVPLSLLFPFLIVGFLMDSFVCLSVGGPLFHLDLCPRIRRVPGDCRNLWTVADLDGDGEGEFITTHSYSFTVVSIVDDRPAIDWARQVNQWEYNRRAGVRACADVNGDGTPEILVSRARGDTLVLDVFGAEENLLLSCDPVVRAADDTCRRWEADLFGVGVVRTGSPGERVIVAAAGRGPVADPRAVIGYDARTGREVWRYETGPNPTFDSFQFLDLDGDRADEILFTMESPCNRRSVGGTDARKAYLVALRADGCPAWLRVLGGCYCYPIWNVVLRHDEGEWIIVTATSTKRAPEEDSSSPPFDTLATWLGRNGERLDAIPSQVPFAGLAVLGPNRIVVSRMDGSVIVFDIGPGGAMHAVRSITAPSPLTIHRAVDLEEDGHPEIVGTDEEMNLILMDHHFRTLASAPLEGKPGIARVAPLRTRLSLPLLLIDTGERFYAFRPRPNSRNSILGVLSGSRLAGVGLLIFFLPVLIHLSRRRSHRRTASPGPKPVGSEVVAGRRGLWEELLQSVRVSRHGKFAATDLIERILWQLRTLLESPTVSPRFLERVETARSDYREVVMPVLVRLSSVCRSLGVKEMEDRLSAASRTFSERLNKILDGKCSASEISEQLPGMEESARAVDGALRRIRALALGALSQDLGKEIERVLDILAGEAAQAGITLRVRFDESAQGGRVRACSGDIPFVVENLLANAVRAVEGSREKKIDLEVRREGKMFLLRVTDTGCGIAKEKWERVLKEGESDRTGGGTGLPLSKRLLESIGGSIRIVSSEPGVGTVIEVRMHEAGEETADLPEKEETA